MITMIHVIEALRGFGGTPRKLLYLTKYAERERCKLVFLLFNPPSLESRFESLEREFAHHGAIIRSVHTASPLKIIWKIRLEAKRFKADAICTHFTRPLITGYLASIYTGLPLIHHEHSSTHYRQGIGRTITKFCLPRAEAIICNSGYTLENIRTGYPGSSENLHLVYNPVEERVALMERDVIRDQMRVKPEDILIGHVGKMIPERDQKTLIRAFDQIHSEFQNTKLVLVGEGPVRSDLEILVKKLGLESDVIFTGPTPDVGEYLNAFDIYVNPTLDEGFGIAVVEAMLSKLPVILSDKGAHPELITEDESGYLYPGGNAELLTKKIRSLIERPEKRKKLGMKAYESAKARFNPSLYASNYFRLVENILRNSKASLRPSQMSDP